MFPHTTERTKTAVDQVGRTVQQMTYFLSSRATLKPSYSYRDNKKIDEKKQNKRPIFLFLVKCQHLTIC